MTRTFIMNRPGFNEALASCHSTTTALSKHLTPEEIKAGTLHSTNKAFERYFQREAKDAKKVYQKIQDIQDNLSEKNENRLVMPLNMRK